MSGSKGFMLYLALLSTLGFLATDMYLPAFTAMQESFHTSAGVISASLTVFLGGFACAQLIWGPFPTASAVSRSCCSAALLPSAVRACCGRMRHGRC